MRVTRSLLRECARTALEQQGFAVEALRGSGIVPGARLRATRGGHPQTVAVRTSLDREIGLTRNADGRWATIPRMDQVLVAVPARGHNGVAEILSFAPDVLVAAFDAALTIRQTENPDFKRKSPIFIALDEETHGSSIYEAGLKAKAEWSSLVPFTSVPRPQYQRKESESEFLERVKQEFAERHGFDPGKVTVQFTITS
jgi:hypothetical protein